MSKASLGAVLLCLLIPCSTPAQARTLELEKGTIRASAGKVVPDRAARGRRAVSLTGTGSLRLRFSTARRIARLTVRARGVRCGGRPRMRVAARRPPRHAAGGAGSPVASGGPRRPSSCRAPHASRGPGQPAPHPPVPPAAAGRLRGRDGAATRGFANSAAGAHPAGHGDAAAAPPRPRPATTTRCSRRQGRPIRWCWTWAARTTTSMPSRPASGSRCCGRAIS